MTASYVHPGMPPLPPPAPLANAYIKPSGPLQQSQPPPAPPPPETTPSPQDDPHRALLVEWRRAHGAGWTRADDLHPTIRRMIDARERMPAIRQRLRQLAGLEAKVVGNAARPTRLYRLVESGLEG